MEKLVERQKGESIYDAIKREWNVPEDVELEIHRGYLTMGGEQFPINAVFFAGNKLICSARNPEVDEDTTRVTTYMNLSPEEVEDIIEQVAEEAAVRKEEGYVRE